MPDPVPQEQGMDPVDALRWIIAHAHDEEALAERAACADGWHTDRRHMRVERDAPLGEFCPTCSSSWWACDGSLPGEEGSYAMEAVARAALASSPDGDVGGEEMRKPFSDCCGKSSSERWCLQHCPDRKRREAIQEQGVDPWTLPEWMEPYRDPLESGLGGNSLENLLNDHKTNSFNNVIRAGLICMADAKVHFLTALRDAGLLSPSLSREEAEALYWSSVVKEDPDIPTEAWESGRAKLERWLATGGTE